MPRRIRVLFLYKWQLATFHRTDLELLRTTYEVRPLCFRFRPIDFAALCVGVWWADVVYVWWADRHSCLAARLARLFRGKLIVVTGGYDVAHEPRIGYGLSTRDPAGVRWTQATFDLCDAILALSGNARAEAERRFRVSAGKLMLVYPGIDSARFRRGNGRKADDLVLTVANVAEDNLRRKGLETFVRAAQYLPDYRFVVAGRWSGGAVERLRSIAGANVTFTGYLADDELLLLYQEAKVYVQVSYHEGFGVALAEAMLCECVPVVTRVGALPEVVGDCGYYVPVEDPSETARRIREAAGSSLGPDARSRVAALFPLQRRRESLERVIQALVEGRPVTPEMAATL